MQIVESQIKARGTVRILNEATSLVEGMIRRIVTSANAIIKVVNEVLQADWGGLIIKVINETSNLVETKIHVLVTGSISSIIKILSDTIQLIEGPLQAVSGIVKVLNESLSVGETLVRDLATFILKVINNAIQTVESTVTVLGSPIIKVISDIVTFVETRLHGAVAAVTSKKTYAAALRAIKKY